MVSKRLVESPIPSYPRLSHAPYRRCRRPTRLSLMIPPYPLLSHASPRIIPPYSPHPIPTYPHRIIPPYAIPRIIYYLFIPPLPTTRLDSVS